MSAFYKSLEDVNYTENEFNYIENKFNQILNIANSHNVSIHDIPKSLIGFAILYDNLRIVKDFCSNGIAFYNLSVGWRKHD